MLWDEIDINSNILHHVSFLSGLWSVLVENDVPHKNLVAFLAYMTYKAAQVKLFLSLYC